MSGEEEAQQAPELTADPKVKKGVKDLALPIKPSATKCCLGLADGIRKADKDAAKKEARRQMGLRVEEKGKVWDGGVVPMIVTCAPQAKEKPMAEAVSLCLALALEHCPQNVALAATANVAKVAVDLCANKSLLVQAHAAMTIAAVAAELEGVDSPALRAKLVSCGAMKQLTAIASAADNEKALADQGVNKVIPYKPGQRQEEAAAALYAVTVDEKAKQSAMEQKTLHTLISLMSNESVIKIVSKKETTESPAVTVRAKVEAVGALLRCVTEPANRAHVCDLGGIAPLVKMLSHESVQARERAAGALHQISMEQALRSQITGAGAVEELLKLCEMGDCSTLAHEEAAGAMLMLANEEDGKRDLCRLHAAKTLATLLDKVKTDGEAGQGVAENVLACVAHMCVHGSNEVRNAKRQMLRVSHTGNARLQDSCSPAATPDLISHVVRHCKDSNAAVSGQAVAALAALCWLHATNARDAGRCQGPKVVMSLLLAVTDDDVRIANLILALTAMAEAMGDNAQVAKRMGAAQRLLVLHRTSANDVVRALAQRLLDVLGCLPSVNHRGAGELVWSLRLARPYDAQAATPRSGLRVGIARLRACRARLDSLLQERPGIGLSLIELSLRDCGNFDGGAGGANGCVRFAAERSWGEDGAMAAALDAALALLLQMHKEFADYHKEFADCVSWADMLYMAAAAALEARGLPPLQMVYGRKDASEDAAVAAPALIPEFAGPPHEALPPPPEASPDGEKDEAPAEGDGAGAGEDGEAKAQVKTAEAPKVQLVVRLSRVGLTAAQQAALVAVYASLHHPARGPVDHAFLEAAARGEGGHAASPAARDTPGGPEAAAAAGDTAAVEGEGAVEEGSVGEDAAGPDSAAAQEHEGGWREGRDLAACRALLQDASVVGAAAALRDRPDLCLALASDAFLHLYSNGAAWEPPLGLMI